MSGGTERDSPPSGYDAFQDAIAGAYSIEREIGRGGMGVVYLARDVALDRPVALKLLHPEMSAREEQRERFAREARTGARLSHPHIVPIFAVEETKGFVFFAMALIDGESLGEKIRREGPIPPAEAERILREAGWALGYAHAMGILHRDITLDNVLLERSTGRVVLADFGIAAELDRAGEGPLVGTPAYLAPELVRQQPPSIQSDLYSLGIMAWAMLAGHFPFDAPEVAQILVKHATEPIPSLIAAAPATSRRLARAIEQCLAKDPAGRPESVEQFLHLLAPEHNSVELATPLRRWITRGQMIRPVWAFAFPMAAMLSVQSLISLVIDNYYGFSHLQDILRPFSVVLGAVALIHLGFEFRELRRLLAAGYSIEDLRLALRRPSNRRVAPTSSLLGRVMHDLTWLSAGTILLAFQYMSTLGPWRMFEEVDARQFFGAVGFVVQWCWIILWTGVGAAFVLPVSPVATIRSLRLSERLWQSRIGALLTHIAGIGLGRSLPAERTLHRPTELVLDLAIDDLWSALPEVTRRDLAPLPAVARGLRKRVAELRELVEQTNAPDVAPSSETRELRHRLEKSHDAGIVALERLRLQLARLTGETRPAGELTQQLQDARALEAELLEELGAHAGLRRQLSGKRATPAIAPTPTPA